MSGSYAHEKPNTAGSRDRLVASRSLVCWRFWLAILTRGGRRAPRRSRRRRCSAWTTAGLPPAISPRRTGRASLRWQAAGFVAPFEFKLGRVNAIHWTPAEKPVKPEGEFCFELGGGDVVFGTLAELDAERSTARACRESAGCASSVRRFAGFTAGARAPT